MAYPGPSVGAHPSSALWMYLIAGVLGGVIGRTVAAMAFRWPATAETAADPLLSATPMLMAAAASMAGVLAGWLIAALIVSRAPG